MKETARSSKEKLCEDVEMETVEERAAAGSLTGGKGASEFEASKF